MAETQATINAWQRERFPTAGKAGVIKHLKEEFGEFLTFNPMVPGGTPSDRLFRVTAGNFVAGFIVRGTVIVRHAPILKKWLAGKTAGVGYRALLNSGFVVEEVRGGC